MVIIIKYFIKAHDWLLSKQNLKFEKLKFTKKIHIKINILPKDYKHTILYEYGQLEEGN